MTWKANRLALRQGSLFPLCASAVAGVVIGTRLQQRLSGRTLSLMFAALLVVIAVDLLLGGSGS